MLDLHMIPVAKMKHIPALFAAASEEAVALVLTSPQAPKLGGPATQVPKQGRFQGRSDEALKKR